jgi:hypothetical protein
VYDYQWNKSIIPSGSSTSYQARLKYLIGAMLAKWKVCAKINHFGESQPLGCMLVSSKWVDLGALREQF